MAANFDGSDSYQISTNSVRQFMEYMEKSIYGLM
jgi:hypothetical protein